MSDYERPIIWELEKLEITRIAYLAWIEGQKYGLEKGRLTSGKNQPEFVAFISSLLEKKIDTIKTPSKKRPWWRIW